MMKMKLRKSQLQEPPWKKNRPVCVACNQTFAIKNGLKNHIQEEHNEVWWNYCGKMFRNWKEVINHMNNVNQPVMNAPQKIRLKMKKKTLLI